jgi:hypothetical protein
LPGSDHRELDIGGQEGVERIIGRILPECVEKANLLLKGYTSHRHLQPFHKEKI